MQVFVIVNVVVFVFSFVFVYHISSRNPGNKLPIFMEMVSKNFGMHLKCGDPMEKVSKNLKLQSKCDEFTEMMSKNFKTQSKRNFHGNGRFVCGYVHIILNFYVTTQMFGTYLSHLEF